MNDGRDAADAPITVTVAWPADRAAHQVVMPLDPSGLEPCAEQTPEIRPAGVGVLAVGQTLSEVLGSCPGARLAWDWGDEAIPEPALLVRLGESVVVTAMEDTLPGSRVYRLVVSDPGPRTSAGVGVGSTWSELTSAYGDDFVLDEGECVLHAVRPAEPRLSWRLRLDDGRGCPEIAALSGEPAAGRIPPGSRVALVFVIGADSVAR